MQILIFPSKSFLLKQELPVLAVVWILCRQTHEQAYVSAGKRLCLQASIKHQPGRRQPVLPRKAHKYL